MLLFSSRWFWIPFYCYLLYRIGVSHGIYDLGWILIGVGVLVVLTDQSSVLLFKEVFLRLRPCHNSDVSEHINLVSDHCGSKYGFVSSHAANVFGVVGLLWGVFRTNNPLRIMIFTWATVVSFSRIYLSQHYPLDVIVGACFGGAVGFLSYRIVRNLIPIR